MKASGFLVYIGQSEIRCLISQLQLCLPQKSVLTTKGNVNTYIND